MTASTSADLMRDLLAHETRVWDALVSGDATADAALLCDSFLGVYPDGFADKAAHAGQLAGGPSIQSYEIDDPRARPLGPDHAILSYRARFRRVNRAADETMYVSSIWERRGAGWVNLLSQDTPSDAP